MIKMDLSNIPYGPTLAHLSTLMLGISTLTAFAWYRPDLHKVVLYVAQSNVSTLIASGLLFLLIAYPVGALIFVPVCMVQVTAETLLAHVLGRSGAKLSVPWKVMVRAVLREANLREPDLGAFTEWNDWFVIFHRYFASSVLNINRVMAALVMGIGVLTLILIIRFPEARHGLQIAIAAFAIGSGLLFSLLAASISNPASSVVIQQDSLFEYLLHEKSRKTAKEPKDDDN